jgi:septal ring factor EnvC (AmiA/AmiB activator)
LAAQERADVAAAQLLDFRSDAATKNETITWLEGQVQRAHQVCAFHALLPAVCLGPPTFGAWHLKALRIRIHNCTAASSKAEASVEHALQEAKEREDSVRLLMNEKESISAAAKTQLQSELEDARAKLLHADESIDKLQRRKAAEMEHVERRVKAAIHRKDDTITALRAQLSEAHQSLRSTERILADDGVDVGAAG